MSSDFAAPLARNTDPETSHEAAAAAVDVAAAHRKLVLGALGLYGPMSKTQIAVRAGMDDVAVARRLPELERAGLAEPTGDYRRSASGRRERVWRATGGR